MRTEGVHATRYSGSCANSMFFYKKEEFSECSWDICLLTARVSRKDLVKKDEWLERNKSKINKAVIISWTLLSLKRWKMVQQ
jgi:hypothetical protein